MRHTNEKKGGRSRPPGVEVSTSLRVRNGLSIVKTVLNNIWTHIEYEDDGHLVHTDKRTGMQFVSVKAWPSLVSARQALDAGFSKIEWEELKEPPPVA